MTTQQELEQILYDWIGNYGIQFKNKQILIAHGIDLDLVIEAIAKLVREEVARAMEKKDE